MTGRDDLELLEVIGSGGFGTVHRAHQPAFSRDVAVKVLATRLVDDTARARFDRECRALGLLSGHPNIVAVHGAGIGDDDRPYIVMEHLPGGTLADRLAQDGPLPWREAAEVGAKLASALQAAHDRGVLHRDLKPSNVLLSAWGEPKLADFGIARIAGEQLTQSQSITASLLYAAPEVLAGETPTEAADVYALATTVHTLMAGRAAFAGSTEESPLAIIQRVGNLDPPSLTDVGVPATVAEVVGRAMSKEPAERFADARAFGTALVAAVDAAEEQPAAPAEDRTRRFAPPPPGATTGPTPPTPTARAAEGTTPPVQAPAPTAPAPATAARSVVGHGRPAPGEATPAAATTSSAAPLPGTTGEAGAASTAPPTWGDEAGTGDAGRGGGGRGRLVAGAAVAVVAVVGIGLATGGGDEDPEPDPTGTAVDDDADPVADVTDDDEPEEPDPTGEPTDDPDPTDEPDADPDPDPDPDETVAAGDVTEAQAVRDRVLLSVAQAPAGFVFEGVDVLDADEPETFCNLPSPDTSVALADQDRTWSEASTFAVLNHDVQVYAAVGDAIAAFDVVDAAAASCSTFVTDDEDGNDLFYAFAGPASSVGVGDEDRLYGLALTTQGVTFDVTVAMVRRGPVVSTVTYFAPTPADVTPFDIAANAAAANLASAF